MSNASVRNVRGESLKKNLPKSALSKRKYMDFESSSSVVRAEKNH